MNIKKIFLFFVLAFSPITSFSGDLFVNEDRIQGGIDVIQTSDVFADIYEKLDNVKWAGKNIEVVIENLEKLNTNAHIAATGERVVLVWGDDLIANFPYPDKKDWKSYGEITAFIASTLESDTG